MRKIIRKHGGSLRLRLIKLLGISVLLASLLAGGISMVSAYHEINEVYDAQLSHATKLLYQFTSQQIELYGSKDFRLGEEPKNISHHYEKNIAFTIWEGPKLLTRSTGADELGSYMAPNGFSESVVSGIKWRFFVYQNQESHITIQAAEKIDIRSELISELLMSLLLPAALFIPVFFFLIWVGTTHSLQPLVRLSEDVNKRGVDDLSPIVQQDLPNEIHPLVKAMNHLLGRVDAAVRQEREFTDNAAHELRTPLAAMKMQVQVLLKQNALADNDKAGLENLLASINRGADLVDQLLAFSRLQNHTDGPEDICQVDEIARLTLSQLKPLAEAKHQKINSRIETNILMHGFEQALSILMRNLVENAIKFTPEGGTIDLSLEKKDGAFELKVADNGIGIPDNQKEKIFDRFYRVHRNAPSGSGLGLAMVKWIADHYNAVIRVENNAPQGTIIYVVFTKG